MRLMKSLSGSCGIDEHDDFATPRLAHVLEQLDVGPRDANAVEELADEDVDRRPAASGSSNPMDLERFDRKARSSSAITTATPIDSDVLAHRPFCRRAGACLKAASSSSKLVRTRLGGPSAAAMFQRQSRLLTAVRAVSVEHWTAAARSRRRASRAARLRDIATSRAGPSRSGAGTGCTGRHQARTTLPSQPAPAVARAGSATGPCGLWRDHGKNRPNTPAQPAATGAR